MVDAYPLVKGPRLETSVRELMTPGVVTVPESASLQRVFEAMRRHHVHAILVISHEDGVPLGWVTSRALLARAHADLSMISARDALDARPVTIAPNATAAEAIERMLAEGVGHLAVCHEGSRSPEGIVSDLDLVELLAR